MIICIYYDDYTQIEGVIDEQDLRLYVTREKFEELCVHLFECVLSAEKLNFHKYSSLLSSVSLSASAF